jgi:hypothetical protein
MDKCSTRSVDRPCILLCQRHRPISLIFLIIDIEIEQAGPPTPKSDHFGAGVSRAIDYCFDTRI